MWWEVVVGSRGVRRGEWVQGGFRSEIKPAGGSCDPRVRSPLPLPPAPCPPCFSEWRHHCVGEESISSQGGPSVSAQETWVRDTRPRTETGVTEDISYTYTVCGTPLYHSGPVWQLISPSIWLELSTLTPALDWRVSLKPCAPKLCMPTTGVEEDVAGRFTRPAVRKTVKGEREERLSPVLEVPPA